MKRLFLLHIISLLSIGSILSQGLTCATAQPFCTDDGTFFTANFTGTGNGQGPQAEPGNNYDCLGTTGNPSWFYFEIDNPGNINIRLSNTNNRDIDFALWGPFPNLAAATSNCGSLGLPTDCSYSTDAVEFANIPNSTTGQVYLLLITNYANLATSIIGAQTSGSGSTDCSIVPDPPTVGQCSNGNNVTIPNNNGQAALSVITNSGSSGNMNAGTTIEQVCILVQHPGLYQLDIWLYEPDGTGINLTNANGGEGDNYGNVSTGGEVCFSATATVPITSYSGGQTGYYIPEQPLSTFNGDPNGEWTLGVWDNQFGHFGEIISWSITFSNGDCSEYCVVYSDISDDICTGDWYDFNGALLTTPGIYSDTLSGANNCDSVVTLNLTVNNLQPGTLDTTVCSGATFVLNSTTYGGANLSGTEIFTDANGCDSVVTVTVTEYPGQTGVFDTTVCSGETFDFNGTTYGSTVFSGTEIFTDANGCDSVVTVTVTEYPGQTGVFDTTVCSGETFDFNGTTYGGTVFTGTEIFMTANGCDSIVTVNVTEFSTQIGTFDTTVCTGETFVFNGTSYGGTVFTGTETFVDANGCDSIVTVNVLEYSTYDYIVTTSSCESTDTGTLVLIGSTINGCDSIVTTLTSFNQSYNVLVTTSSCNPSDTGVFVDTQLTTQGCDSITTTVINLVTSFDIIITDYSCNPVDTGTVVIDDVTQTGCDSTTTIITLLNPSYELILFDHSCDPADTGVVIQLLQTVNGCDSIITTIITLDPSYDIEFNYSSCFPGDTGVVVIPLQTYLGCDSIITIITTLDQLSIGFANPTICQGDSATINGIDFYQVQGVYMDTIAGYDCDSVVTLDLIVDIPPNSAPSMAICSGDSVTVDGITYFDSTGTYVVVIPGGVACDETVTLSLIVLPFAMGHADIFLCEGDSATINGQEFFTSSGIYNDTIPGINCDSIVFLTLLVSQKNDVFIDQITCDTNQAGIVTHQLVNEADCDSIVTITTTFSPIDFALVDPANADCNGANGSVFISMGAGFPPFEYEVIGEDNYLSSATGMLAPLNTGSYTVSVTDSFGCFVSDTFFISQDPLFAFHAVNESFSLLYGESVLLEVVPDTGNISWNPVDFLSCDTCAITTATPEHDILYIVTSQIGVCAVTDTIRVEVFQPDVLVPSAFSPNGDGANDLFQVIDQYIEEFFYLKLYNRWGELLFETEDVNEGWNGYFNGDQQEMDSYIYHILVRLTNGRVADVSGNFILLR